VFASPYIRLLSSRCTSGETYAAEKYRGIYIISRISIFRKYMCVYIYICTKCTLFSNVHHIATAAAVKRALTFRLTAWPKYFCLILRDAAGQFHSVRRCWKIDTALRDFMTHLTGRVSRQRRYNLIASCELALATSCTLRCSRKNDEKNDEWCVFQSLCINPVNSILTHDDVIRPIFTMAD